MTYRDDCTRAMTLYALAAYDVVDFIEELRDPGRVGDRVLALLYAMLVPENQVGRENTTDVELNTMLEVLARRELESRGLLGTWEVLCREPEGEP